MINEVPPISCAALHALIVKTIEEIQADIDAYDERAAILQEAIDSDGKTTDQRAIEALKRPERFAGEHEVAKAWLFNSKTASCWSKNGSGR